MNELKIKLAALGLDEEQVEQVIATVGEFAKSKLPPNLHPMLNDVLSGKSPDLGPLAGMLGGLKGMFGGL
ncbi:hypothetical protein JIN85_09590 [Luteolibacter pohnpeiensis]|uniref:DUF2267 domain-containing protein n=1 Tax=Luteolibacter pohnpeiensis TaxID=454153 RepID=A0A934SB54_9BACT|nr:hypothetical protein [Luteolibacter pohnpeiensis]MBK1882669.1 hypothetical protein [Luteolibacter pohnpeiensis]